MTRRQVWQYRCEFCGKRGLSSGHMKAHEKSCTANPERVCRFHPRLTGEPAKRSARELTALLAFGKESYGMKEVREAAENCPICILAAVRQSGIQKWDGDPESPPIDLGFDFKAELKSAWETINDAEYERA